MSSPESTTQVRPNLWHFSALSWSASNLLLSLFAMPISVNPTGLGMQLALSIVHLVGVIYLWRAARRGNPERLMNAALITLVFIYLAPLCMLIAPVIVLAAYSLPTPAWKTVASILAAAGIVLVVVRIRNTASDKNTGRRFETFLSDEIKDNVITSESFKILLNYVGRHATAPTRIDGWSMIAAVTVGAPILLANVSYDKSSSSLAICAFVATPMAMHVFSRMVVHCYLWIFRLRRFEREVGFSIVVRTLK